jgi:putative membrane protein
MYVDKRIGILEIFIRGWKDSLFVLAVVTATTALYLEFLHEYIRTSLMAVTVLGTALSFFIGFINAQAYDRWWEARKIWGTLVNDSRSFARMVLTMFDSSKNRVDAVAIQDRLIRRHIGFLYAVKEWLRRENTREYLDYLSGQDEKRIDGLKHAGNAILKLQGEEIDRAEREGYIEVIRMAQLNDMLSRFSTSMGMAERIKLTVFPVYYATLIRLSVWAFVIVFPTALSVEVGYWAIPYTFLLGEIFQLISAAGKVLMNPFEGRSTDVPMSSIVRTIEINLLEQLGVTELPPPVEPVNGRYLL